MTCSRGLGLGSRLIMATVASESEAEISLSDDIIEYSPQGRARSDGGGSGEDVPFDEAG